MGVVFKNIMRLIACGLALWITTLIFKIRPSGLFIISLPHLWCSGL